MLLYPIQKLHFILMYYLHEAANGLSLFKVKHDKAKLVKQFEFERPDQALIHLNAQKTPALNKLMKDFQEIPDAKMIVSCKEIYKLVKKQFNYKPIVDEDQSIQLEKQIRDLLPSSNQMYLSHQYSRLQLQINSESVDLLIVESTNLLLQLDKEINLYRTKLFEWCCWSFPELYKVNPEKFVEINAIIGGSCKFLQDIPFLTIQEQIDIEKTASTSTGSELTDDEVCRIKSLANLILTLQSEKQKLESYITNRMTRLSPQLCQLIDSLTAAKLLTRAHSLKQLCKMPASSLQILGAELTLFNALAENGKTPKFGFIYKMGMTGGDARRLACNVAKAVRCDYFGGKLEDQNIKSGVKAEKDVGQQIKEQIDEVVFFE
uniref:Nucleolar protein NOP5 n=1 Tax=Trepomonas sp. PC1 TaxID=1076344 RepID=A0A146KA22_9EUKA|eukprot:JAP93683.1 Nucleolar protein NOP5 [Trepomonas sp. PC1]